MMAILSWHQMVARLMPDSAVSFHPSGTQTYFLLDGSGNIYGLDQPHRYRSISLSIQRAYTTGDEDPQQPPGIIC